MCHKSCAVNNIYSLRNSYNKYPLYYLCQSYQSSFSTYFVLKWKNFVLFGVFPNTFKLSLKLICHFFYDEMMITV